MSVTTLGGSSGNFAEDNYTGLPAEVEPQGSHGDVQPLEITCEGAGPCDGTLSSMWLTIFGPRRA
jgi:hypothetical protein